MIKKSQDVVKSIFFLFISVVLVFYIIFYNVDSGLFDFAYNATVRIVPNENRINHLPWYFKNGTIRPTVKNAKKIWSEETQEDRIANQLMYLPEGVPAALKKIYLFDRSSFKLNLGRKIFKDSQCPVGQCVIVDNKTDADVLIFRNEVTMKRNFNISLNQIWIFFSLENPFNAGEGVDVNWTATYRHDSDIQVPYAKWQYYNENVTSQTQEVNYAKGKTKKVAWFVSNCHAKNNRLEYALELSKYIDIDIYGKCGSKKCKGTEKCFQMLRKDYKFYLAFENANCRDYITEKFFHNSLMNDVLPVVMGAHPDDLRKMAPIDSFIHVDDFDSPKQLAAYLNLLDEDDDLYNAYFQWKGAGEFIKNYFFCRLCALLHSKREEKYYEDFMKWWNGTNVCISGSWYNQTNL